MLVAFLPLALAASALAAGAQPAIEELTASKVTAHSVQLRARIDPNGAKTEYTFFLEYKICQGQGVCSQLWRQTEVGSGTIPAGTKGVSVTARPRLTPDCAYEYHVVASNRYGTSHTGEKPGERGREFLTKRAGPPSEPHDCEASA